MDHDGDRLMLMSLEDTCHFLINYCGEHKGNNDTETSSLLNQQQFSNELNVFWVKEKCNLWLKKEESWKLGELVPLKVVMAMVCALCKFILPEYKRIATDVEKLIIQ